MIVLAHVSDPHFDADPRNAQRVDGVFAYINSLPNPPDAVLVTGDITDHGTAQEYAQARESLRSDLPILLCPGNHDERGAYRVGLLDEDASTAPINRVHNIAGAVVAMADSTLPGEAGGKLAPETIDWLRSVLDDAPEDAPIFIAFHHPPTRLFSPIVDSMQLDDDGALADLVSSDDRIAALLCGHAHTSAVTTFAGVPLLVGSSVSSVLGPDWEGKEQPVIDYEIQPSLAFHVLDDDGRLTTHFRVIA